MPRTRHSDSLEMSYTELFRFHDETRFGVSNWFQGLLFGVRGNGFNG